MRFRSLITHKNRRRFFWLLNFIFLGSAAYLAYVGNFLGTLSMLFVSIYMQTLIRVSELEQKLDAVLDTESRSL